MKKILGFGALACGVVAVSAPAFAASICMRTLTDVEILHRVRQDAYFTRDTPTSPRLRLDYDNGCGYLVHVGERPPAAHDGDLLFVDPEGRVVRTMRRSGHAAASRADRAHAVAEPERAESKP